MTDSALFVITAGLFLYTFMLARSREVAIHQVVFVSLMGFFLAQTSLGKPIWELLATIITGYLQ
ncbi:hypothetical protein [Streptomyces niveiscabiei]|uniref:Secreted protein n=1 Tax=Streptomyces niveiscabiei TaxID=164115 RepID=A0ABW9I5S3_9ACTN